MDYIAHFERETTAFHRAALMAALADTPPPVPSCPEWNTSDLIKHLGGVHRRVNHVIEARLQEPPNDAEVIVYPEDTSPSSLADWFAEGAIALTQTFRATDPDLAVWTWWTQHDVAFWTRVQSVEAAVHRWDMEGAIGSPQPVDKELAVDAVTQNFEVMIPARIIRKSPPPGTGERYRFRQTDGSGVWSIAFDPDGTRTLADDEPADVELAGTASDLMLFLWNRIPGEPLKTSGSTEVLERFFMLAPPV